MPNLTTPKNHGAVIRTWNKDMELIDTWTVCRYCEKPHPGYFKPADLCPPPSQPLRDL